MSHKACRVVGKTVDQWGRDDPFVQLFLNEVLPTGGDHAANARINRRPGRGAELAYALQVMPITLPSLKVRSADIGTLSRAILASAPALRDAPKVQLTDAACDRIARLELPGNLPQLRALLQRAVLLATDLKCIDARDIDAALALEPPPPERVAHSDIWEAVAPEFEEGSLTLDSLNVALRQKALVHTDNNVAAAARLLGLTRPQLAYRLAQSEPAGNH